MFFRVIVYPSLGVVSVLSDVMCRVSVHQERHASHPPRIGVPPVTTGAVVSRRVSVSCVNARDSGRDLNARIRSPVAICPVNKLPLATTM